MDMLEENFKFISTRQQKRSKKARELYESMLTPPVDYLKVTVQMNIIKDNVVTTYNVNLATKAYGMDVGQIKDKTTRSRPTPVVRKIVETPNEFLEVKQDLTV